MAKAWHEIASVVGGRSAVSLGFSANVTIPDETDGVRASEAQEDAVRAFYLQDFASLTASQAHVLLSYREFARLSADILFKRYGMRTRRSLAACLAAFISSDTRMADFVCHWSEAAYRRGSASPRVRNSPIFRDVEDFAAYLAGSIEIAGFTADMFD